MALALGVTNGKQIRIGGKLLTVKKILSSARVLVSFEDRDILVTDLQRVELMPECYVSAGTPDDGCDTPPSTTRLAFEAPRAVRIERLPDRRAA